MDPPYRENLTVKTLMHLSKYDILEQDGIIICEHGRYENLENTIGNFIKYDEREYNKKIVTFYVRGN